MHTERDETIDRQWAWIVEHRDPNVRRLARLAVREPLLRSLFPYASHCDLRFSRCTEYPWDPLPGIMTRDEYIVCDPWHEPITRGSAEETVRRLVVEMPSWLEKLEDRGP